MSLHSSLLLWRCGPTRAMAPSFLRFLDHDATQSVRLLWMSDLLVAKTCTWQHTTLTTNIHSAGGKQTHNFRRRAAAEPLLRTRNQWESAITIILVESSVANSVMLQLYTYIYIYIYDILIKKFSKSNINSIQPHSQLPNENFWVRYRSIKHRTLEVISN